MAVRLRTQPSKPVVPLASMLLATICVLVVAEKACELCLQSFRIPLHLALTS